MRKNITKLLIVLVLLSISTEAYGQIARIGFNTTDPMSTMDVSGQKDSSRSIISTDITGLQAPTPTRTELTTKCNILYGTSQKGALVYITDIK